MAVTITGAVVVDVATALVQWSSDRTPPLDMRAYWQGRLFASWRTAASSGELLVPLNVGEYPFVEIKDNPEEARTPAFPGRILLHWAAVAGAAEYRVEEQVGADWVQRVQMPADGRAYYGWLTNWLADSSTHNFRISSIDSGNNVSVGSTIAVTMRRHPDLPQVSVALNGDGTLTIS